MRKSFSLKGLKYNKKKYRLGEGKAHNLLSLNDMNHTQRQGKNDN